MKCDFSIRHYREVLEKAKETYSFYTFKDLPKKPSAYYILLRHDVDAEPDKALQMAEIDHDLGIASTFFFRMHGSYNLFSEEAYSAVKRIINLGHEVGFHYELFQRRGGRIVTDEKILVEIEFFEKVFNMKVETVAAHNPSAIPSVLSLKKVKEKYLDAYSPPFFIETKYISDSNKIWREGCMCKWINIQHPRLQILVHPHWWDGISLQEHLQKYGVS